MKIDGVKRNVPQTKEHKKSLGKKLNDMDAPKIPDAEFKTMFITMFKGIRGTVNDLNENLNKEIVSIKKNIEITK